MGPLPPSVYWRRRFVAATGTFLVLALLVWAVVGLAGAGEEVAPTSAAARSAGAPDPAAPDPAAPDPADPAGTAPSGAAGAGPARGSRPVGAASAAGTPPSPAALAAGLPPLSGPPAGAAAGVLTPGTPGSALGPTVAGPARPVPADAISPAGSGPFVRASSDPTAQAPAGPVLPAAGPTATAAPPAARAAAPAPPPCSDGAIGVTARTDKPAYARGEKPLLSLVVTNTGPAACTRDLDAARQAVAVVRKPGDGLWGSNDCSPGHTQDVRTLAPGQEAVFAVRWSGRTSLPGCGGKRTEVPPGRYQLLARLDTTISDPAPFTLR